MIRPKLSLRRPLAVLGATFVGLAAAVAIATPASAHHSVVNVKSECVTGEWVVTWTVNSVAPVNHYKLIEVTAKTFAGATASAASIQGIAVTEGNSYPHRVGEPLVGTQHLPGTTTEASLEVKAKWENGYVEDDAKGASIKLSGTCKKEEIPPPATAKPTASAAADCQGDVAVKLANAEDATAPAKFTVTGSDGFKETATVAPGKDETVKVPAKNASNIKVTAAGEDKPLFNGEPAEAKNCVEPGEPAGSFRSTCDELIFEIANPQDGKSITVTFTPNRGEAKSVTAAPGETKTVSFKASEGLTVTPSAEGMDNAAPIAWKKPADCQSGGTGGSLPLTGVAATSIAGGALVLLAIGVGLFLVARRRRVKFTA